MVHKSPYNSKQITLTSLIETNTEHLDLLSLYILLKLNGKIEI